jgi:2'-hydroxyisoflavone reductase
VSAKAGPYSGYGRVSNAAAIAAGLSFRPLATTVSDLLAWFGSLPADRQATVRAGISRDKEAELLRAWRARAGA